jgi:RNA polymerase sigma-70 factor (ECF subfamily)
MTEQAVAPNENEAVVCLYDRYGPSMYRYALILLTDQAAAEDAVHEVFTSVLRSGAIARLEADERYLRRAIRNECFSMLRQKAKHQWIPVPGGLLERIASADSKPDERLALEGGIRLLTPEQREIVHLHVFEGLTFREIAEASCTSPNTVAARYRYALAKLRVVLDGGRTDDARQSRR